MASTMTTVALAAILLATGTSALAQDQVVRIGVSGPLSGANAFAGKDDENGVRLAVEELNAQKLKVGGKTLKFELLSEDDQGIPTAGVNVAQKFADAGVKFVLGPYNSGVAIPASRVYNDAGILMSTVGTSPKVTRATTWRHCGCSPSTRCRPAVSPPPACGWRSRCGSTATSSRNQPTRSTRTWRER